MSLTTSDFACLFYPTTFKKVYLFKKEVGVKCSVCKKTFRFRKYKDVNSHTELPGHNKVRFFYLVLQT